MSEQDYTEYEDERDAEERLQATLARLEDKLKRTKPKVESNTVASIRRARLHLEYLESRSLARCEKDIRLVDDQLESLLSQIDALRSRRVDYQDFIDNREEIVSAQKDRIANLEAFHAQEPIDEGLDKLTVMQEGMKASGMDQVDIEDLRRVLN